VTSGGFIRLDAADPGIRREYERAFYEAFARVQTNRLVRRLWLWDDENLRLRVRLAYEDHAIWASRRANGELHYAIAAHADPTRAQSAAYGFEIPHEPGVFEVLTFFAAGPTSFAEARAFWRSFLAHMRAAGLARGYATCASRMLPLYTRAGWEAVAAREIESETRHFLELRFDSPRVLTLLDARGVDRGGGARFEAA
jgi:hypothetical protein